jgi:hypothetical protein
MNGHSPLLLVLLALALLAAASSFWRLFTRD